MVEEERLVYADRARYLGDPDFYQVPIKELTDPDYFFVLTIVDSLIQHPTVNV